MAPRGLKASLKKPNVKLEGAGKFKGYARINPDGSSGRKLKGVTKALATRIFSDGALPWGSGSRLGWKGKGGGRRRGSAVDAQLSRIVNAGQDPAKFRLTRWPSRAQKSRAGTGRRTARRCKRKSRHGRRPPLLPQEEQSTGRRGSQVRVYCVRHAGDQEGRRCKMRAPLSQVDDTALHRHLAQLAATRQMLLGDVDVVKKLQELSLDGELGAVLLYLDDESVELFDLPDWWLRRGAKLLKALGG